MLLYELFVAFKLKVDFFSPRCCCFVGELLLVCRVDRGGLHSLATAYKLIGVPKLTVYKLVLYSTSAFCPVNLSHSFGFREARCK